MVAFLLFYVWTFSSRHCTLFPFPLSFIFVLVFFLFVRKKHKEKNVCNHQVPQTNPLGTDIKHRTKQKYGWLFFCKYITWQQLTRFSPNLEALFGITWPISAIYSMWNSLPLPSGATRSHEGACQRDGKLPSWVAENEVKDIYIIDQLEKIYHKHEDAMVRDNKPLFQI